MTEKEFKELKVGDKIRIISMPVSETPMGISSMDKWSGKIMTIREIYIDNIRPCARMKEDETSNIFLRVVWFPEMIAEKVSDATRKIEPNTAYRTLTRENYDDLMKEAERQGYKWASGSNPTKYNGFEEYESKTVICFHNDKCVPKCMTYMSFDRCKGNKIPEWHVKKKTEVTIVMHLIKDGKTVVKLSDGRVGVAFCSPEDTFNEYEGVRLATARAYGKEPPAKKSKVKEVKRRAKVGEYIKIVNKSAFCVSYENGEIFKVKSTTPLGSAVVRLENSFHMPMHDEEYVVLEGYNPKK